MGADPRRTRARGPNVETKHVPRRDEGASARQRDDLIGEVLEGKYRIDALIGSGGMAEVYRARHLRLNRDVAIKVLHLRMQQDDDICARFDREARAASRLDHPNCMQVTDFGTTAEGRSFMVMQLLEGQPLSERLGAPIPPVEAGEWMLQILRGLAHAHKHGVVHRDIKPDNLFVTRDHQGADLIKLVDFGIAKVFYGSESRVRATKMGMVFGTPQYMSPEQAAGLPEIDGRTDLYSAGLVFYEMLSGRPAITAPDAVSMVRMQISADPAPLPDTVPPPLARVVASLLCKQRDERVLSAEHACQSLAASIREIKTGSRRSPRGQPRLWTDRPHPTGGTSREREALSESLDRVLAAPVAVPDSLGPQVPGGLGPSSRPISVARTPSRSLELDGPVRRGGPRHRPRRSQGSGALGIAVVIGVAVFWGYRAWEASLAPLGTPTDDDQQAALFAAATAAGKMLVVATVTYLLVRFALRIIRD